MERGPRSGSWQAGLSQASSRWSSMLLFPLPLAVCWCLGLALKTAELLSGLVPLSPWVTKQSPGQRECPGETHQLWEIASISSVQRTNMISLYTCHQNWKARKCPRDPAVSSSPVISDIPRQRQKRCYPCPFKVSGWKEWDLLHYILPEG